LKGFIFKGVDAERHYHETGKFEYVSNGGYYHSLPGDTLRLFIDSSAEVQRAMGFQNEKDHPEVAPSQFEINYGYAEVVAAADQIQIYKLICRQIATRMGLTACFLPKPIVGVNGTGMHTNVSITKEGKNLFWDPEGLEKMSEFSWKFVDRILTHGNDLCLLMNSSVNAYRRLDPHFEAPNQLKASATDRGSMVRIPDRQLAQRPRRSPRGGSGRQSVHGAVRRVPHRHRGRHRADREPAQRAPLFARQHLRRHRQLREVGMDHQAAGRGCERPLRRFEEAAADRCPRLLGTVVKAPEVQFHHEVYTQYLWNLF
jgi:glutamine synthetase